MPRTSFKPSASSPTPPTVKGARGPPPPGIDPEAPELPFHSGIDGIACEFEPWEQAQRNRLKAYAKERDQVAGIIIYDGEWNEANWTPSEADASPADEEC